MQVSELKYFKEILEDRKQQILKNIEGGHDELNQLSSCELNDEGDYASNSSSSMVESAIVEQQKQELRDIHIALGKIALGEYGTCAMCGVEIGFARLKVKPHAIYCIDCREFVEQEQE